MTDATEEPLAVPTPLMATASYATPTHEVILKVVDLGDAAIGATVNLRGAGPVAAAGRAIVLAGNPDDVNTVDEPTKIAPVESPPTDAGPTFGRTFGPHPLTLLRLSARPR